MKIPSYKYTFVCGMLVWLMGITVMMGWHSGDIRLIQINPAFVPMQYNTALCFLFSGISIVFLSLRNKKLSKTLASLIFLISSLTLAEYIFKLDFHIDQILMDHNILTQSPYPGRMAPNTAICFLLTSSALFFGSRNPIGMTCAASTVLVFALMALGGYLTQKEGLYGWGDLTRMALHTAAGFLIVGVGLLFYTIDKLKKKNVDFWKLAPFSVVTIVLVLTFFAWYAVEESSTYRNKQYFYTLIADTQNALTNRYALYQQSLQSGLGLYYASKSIERNEWIAFVDTLDIERTLPGINGIGYIDYVLSQNIDEYLEQAHKSDLPDLSLHPDTFFPDKFVIRYIEPFEKNKEAMGMDIGFESNRRTAAERARDLGVPALTKKINFEQDHKNEAGFLLLLPVYNMNHVPKTIEERRARFKGWVYAPFIGESFLQNLGSNSTLRQIGFAVYDGKRASPEALIYDASKARSNNYDYETQTNIEIAGRTWTLTWHTSKDFMPPRDSHISTFIMLFGPVLAGFLYLMLTQLIRRKQIIIEEVNRQTATIKLNEIALQASEEQFRSAMEYSAIGMALVSTEGKWLKVNKALTDLLGYSEDELIRIDFQTITHPDDLKKDLSLVADILNGKRDSYQMEKRYIHKHGHIVWTLLSVSVAWNTDDTPKHFISQIQNISERKEIEVERENLMTALSRSNEELERFAYIASHDLQEPLRMVRSFTGLLEERYADKLDDTARQYIDFAHSSATQMQLLVNDLLEYSRIGSEAEKYEVIDANQILGDALENLQERISATNAVITNDILPEIFANPVRMMRLFQNLVGNGLKYQKAGTIPKIHVGVKDEDSFWLFSFTDNGIGIKEEYRTKVFEPFKRLHNKSEYHGTGMGLSICKKIVEDFGGKIWIESAPDQGCIFKFTIPKRSKINEEKKL